MASGWLQLARGWRAWAGWRDRAAAARRPIPDDLWKRTLLRYPFLQRREAADAAALRHLTSVFLDRKEFTVTGGLQLRDAMAVTIAAQAVLPILKLGLARYDGFVGLVVHAGPVRAARSVTDADGLVHEYDEELSGEAMEGGPVMLSWHDVGSAGQTAAQAYNVVIHEFAHVLDMADGVANGVPELPAHISRANWTRILQAEFLVLSQRVRAHEPTAIDSYGSDNLEEFFAVATEAFFVNPVPMQIAHPALYALFTSFYGQDPAQDTPPSRQR